MESLSKVFNHSRQHIVWNSGDFFTDGLLQFFEDSKTMFKNFSFEIPFILPAIRKSHRGLNQGSEEAVQRLPVTGSDDQEPFLTKWRENYGLYGLLFHLVETGGHRYRIRAFSGVKSSPQSTGWKYRQPKSRGTFSSRTRWRLHYRCFNCGIGFRCSYGLGTSSWFFSHCRPPLSLTFFIQFKQVFRYIHSDLNRTECEIPSASTATHSTFTRPRHADD